MERRRTNARRKISQFLIVDRDKRNKTDASDSYPSPDLQIDASLTNPISDRRDSIRIVLGQLNINCRQLPGFFTAG